MQNFEMTRPVTAADALHTLASDLLQAAKDIEEEGRSSDSERFAILCSGQAEGYRRARKMALHLAVTFDPLHQAKQWRKQ